MPKLVAYLVALVLTCNLAVVAVNVLADKTTLITDGGRVVATTLPPGPAPAPGQTFVTGSADRFSADDAQSGPLRSPLTIQAVERGVGRVVIENALVADKRVAISWGGGTPLPLTGDGGIDLGGTHVEVDGTGVTWTIDGGAKALLPGKYRAGASVAVGSAGLATPRDGVDFTADARTTLTATGGVVIKLPPQQVEITGPGKVVTGGQLRVRSSSSTRQATGVEFGPGPFTVTLAPAAGRLDVNAVLQGDVKAT